MLLWVLLLIDLNCVLFDCCWSLRLVCSLLLVYCCGSGNYGLGLLMVLCSVGFVYIFAGLDCSDLLLDYLGYCCFAACFVI